MGFEGLQYELMSLFWAHLHGSILQRRSVIPVSPSNCTAVVVVSSLQSSPACLSMLQDWIMDNHHDLYKPTMPCCNFYVLICSLSRLFSEKNTESTSAAATQSIFFNQKAQKNCRCWSVLGTWAMEITSNVVSWETGSSNHVGQVLALWPPVTHSWCYTTAHHLCSCVRSYVPWATAQFIV